MTATAVAEAAQASATADLPSTTATLDGEMDVRRHQVLDAVADAAVILTPSHLTGVGAADTMVNPHLGAAKAVEERLRLMGAGVAPELLWL